jgi:hypothetical protein
MQFGNGRIYILKVPYVSPKENIFLPHPIYVCAPGFPTLHPSAGRDPRFIFFDVPKECYSCFDNRIYFLIHRVAPATYRFHLFLFSRRAPRVGVRRLYVCIRYRADHAVLCAGADAFAVLLWM